MNGTERLAFEAEMSSDPELKKEYELQREIALAVQRVHLKRHMQNIEQQAKNVRRRKIKTMSVWFTAAAIACVCIVGLDMKLSSDLREASAAYYAETMMPPSRSDNDVDFHLSRAYKYIGEDNYDGATQCLAAASFFIEQQLQYSAPTEEYEYNREVVLMKKQDVAWYRTLILMKQGKILKSRKALKSIEESDSRYADEARKILETNYPF